MNNFHSSNKPLKCPKVGSTSFEHMIPKRYHEESSEEEDVRSKDNVKSDETDDDDQKSEESDGNRTEESNEDAKTEESNCDKTEENGNEYYESDELHMWQNLFVDVLKGSTLTRIEEIYRSPEYFMRFLKAIRKEVQELADTYDLINDGQVMQQVDDEIYRLTNKCGYKEDEAIEAAWFNRRFLFKKLLKDSKHELISRLFNDSDE